MGGKTLAAVLIYYITWIFATQVNVSRRVSISTQNNVLHDCSCISNIFHLISSFKNNTLTTLHNVGTLYFWYLQKTADTVCHVNVHHDILQTFRLNVTTV